MEKDFPFDDADESEILDKLTVKASKMAEEFTEKSFDKIWNIGMAKEMSEPLNKEELARMMFYSGATQILVKYWMDGYEDGSKNQG